MHIALLTNLDRIQLFHIFAGCIGNYFGGRVGGAGFVIQRLQYETSRNDNLLSC